MKYIYVSDPAFSDVIKKLHIISDKNEFLCNIGIIPSHPYTKVSIEDAFDGRLDIFPSSARGSFYNTIFPMLIEVHHLSKKFPICIICKRRLARRIFEGTIGGIVHDTNETESANLSRRSLY